MTSMTPLVDELRAEMEYATEGLWDHQREYVERRGMDREHLLLWQPRTGKSLATIRSATRWHVEANVQRVILVAPKTVCQVVWAPVVQAEAARWHQKWASVTAGGPQLLDLYSDSIDDRKARLKDARGQSGWTIAIVNRDVLSDLVEDLLKWAPEALVLDEVHDFKTPSSGRARAAFRIGRAPSVRFRRGLTGTPASEGAEDLYGQWKIISPTTFGTNKSAFLERYVVFDAHAHYPKIIGYRNVAEMQSKAFKIATIIKRSDCFDIPPEQDVERLFDLPPTARKVYDTIVKDHVLELQTANTTGIELPIRHTFARIAQLRQVAIGYARFVDPDKDPVAYDDHKRIEWLHDAKLEIVRSEVEDIVESGEKVVVFHAFSPEREHLMESLAAWKPLALYGGSSDADRVRALALFATNDNFPVIVVQEAVGSLGISLAAANYAIFASFGLARATHIQARDRIFKPADAAPGKTLTTVYPLAANSIEVAMRAMHVSKASAEEFLLSGDRSQNFVHMARGGVK